jgi:hypothetical protein
MMTGDLPKFAHGTCRVCTVFSYATDSFDVTSTLGLKRSCWFTSVNNESNGSSRVLMGPSMLPECFISFFTSSMRHASVSHGSNLQREGTKKSGLHSDWEVEVCQSLGLQFQIPQYHISFEDGYLERLGIEALHISPYISIQIVGKLCLKHPGI